MSGTATIDWSAFAKIVRTHDRFVLTCHARPDCDAVGSELGMCGALEAMGKQVRIVNPDAVPKHLAFIDPEQRVEVLGQHVSAIELEETDVLMVLDTSAWAQLGGMADVVRATKATRVVVDHHVSHDDLGATMFRDASAEATGRLVIDAADALGAKITSEMARALFAAIATDTGWFRFGSTTGDTLRYTARLIDAGADPTDLYGMLYEQVSLSRIRLLARILENATRECDNRLIHSRALRTDFDTTSASDADTDGAVNEILSVHGTEVAVLFTETRGWTPEGELSQSIVDRRKSNRRSVWRWGASRGGGRDGRRIVRVQASRDS